MRQRQFAHHRGLSRSRHRADVPGLQIRERKRLLYRSLAGINESVWVGIARAKNGDLTPAGEKFCEMLRKASKVPNSRTTKAVEQNTYRERGQCHNSRGRERKQSPNFAQRDTNTHVFGPLTIQPQKIPTQAKARSVYKQSGLLSHWLEADERQNFHQLPSR